MKTKVIARRAHHFAVSLLGKESVIIDLGANRGHFSNEVISDCGATCYAIEAVPRLYELIPQNPRIRKFNLAICDADKPVRFNISTQEESGSMSTIPDAMLEDSIEVQGMTLKSFMNANHLDHVDLLKMDIEGAEIDLLKSIDDDTLRKIRQITVEFHDFLPYFDQDQDIILIKSRLKRLGFTCVKYSMSCHADVLFINRRTAGISLTEIAYLCWIDRHIRAAKRGIIRLLKR
jgi:FkbM family methyltransferase